MLHMLHMGIWGATTTEPLIISVFPCLQIVFEGVVGRNSLGNIAIDDVSIVPGVCPSKNKQSISRLQANTKLTN